MPLDYLHLLFIVKKTFFKYIAHKTLIGVMGELFLDVIYF